MKKEGKIKDADRKQVRSINKESWEYEMKVKKKQENIVKNTTKETIK